MILRQWRGRTAWTRADEYTSYLLETGVRDCEKTPGCRGVYVLRRRDGDEAEFVFHSLWDSFDAIRRFAGPDVEKAVYYPEDRAFLRELEPRVTHYEILHEPVANASRGGEAASPIRITF